MKKLRTKQCLPRLLDFGRPSGFGRPKKVGFRTSEKGRTADAGSNLLRRKCRKSENFRTSEKGVGWSRDLSTKLDFGRKLATLEAKLEGKEEKLGRGNAKGSRSTC